VLARTLVLLLLAALGCRSSAEAPRDPALRPVDGPGVRRLVEAADAEAVVLNFWATWCEPCKEEFPMLVRVGRAYAARGVRLHFVNMDFPSERSAAVAFLRAQGAALPSYAKTGKDHAFITAIHPRWSGVLPATIIFADGGELRHFWEGRIDEATLSGALDALLEETPASE
jgi:thiol-disulfide isomerase/thioredoxin